MWSLLQTLLIALGLIGIVLFLTSYFSGSFTFTRSDKTTARTWIDPDTNDLNKLQTSYVDGKRYQLIFSDEFNQDGRLFKPGSDPRWNAIDKTDPWLKNIYYSSNPDYSFTSNGSLVLLSSLGKVDFKEQMKSIIGVSTNCNNVEDCRNLTLWSLQNVTRNAQNLQLQSHVLGSMLQTWDTFCFTGGIVDINLKVSARNSHPFRFAVKLLGNLVREKYEDSYPNIWGWSYDSCTNSSIGLKQLFSSCTGDYFVKYNSGVTRRLDFKNYQGRGAPEITVAAIEPTCLSNATKYTTSSIFAPSGLSFASLNSSELLIGPRAFRNDGFGLTAPGRDSNKIYKFDNLSAYMIEESNTTDDQFHAIRLEWSPLEYINVYVDGQLLQSIDAVALEESGALISDEPMYMTISAVMTDHEVNASAHNNTEQLVHIDYVRVYQDSANPTHTVGCSPPSHPTSYFIRHFFSLYGSELRFVSRGGATCSSDYECGFGTCSARKVCMCSSLRYTGPNCKAATVASYVIDGTSAEPMNDVADSIVSFVTTLFFIFWVALLFEFIRFVCLKFIQARLNKSFGPDRRPESGESLAQEQNFDDHDLFMDIGQLSNRLKEFDHFTQETKKIAWRNWARVLLLAETHKVSWQYTRLWNSSQIAAQVSWDLITRSCAKISEPPSCFVSNVLQGPGSTAVLVNPPRRQATWVALVTNYRHSSDLTCVFKEFEIIADACERGGRNAAFCEETRDCLAGLYISAISSLKTFREVLSWLERDPIVAQDSPTCSMGPLKLPVRCLEKSHSDYKNDPLHLLDIVRASLICNSVDAIERVLSLLTSRMLPYGSLLLRIKNGFNEGHSINTYGYRDIKINVWLAPWAEVDLRTANQTDSHVYFNPEEACRGIIGEIQIHLKDFYDLKKALGHSLYGWIRRFNSQCIISPEILLEFSGEVGEATSALCCKLLQCILFDKRRGESHSRLRSSSFDSDEESKDMTIVPFEVTAVDDLNFLHEGIPSFLELINDAAVQFGTRDSEISLALDLGPFLPGTTFAHGKSATDEKLGRILECLIVFLEYRKSPFYLLTVDDENLSRFYAHFQHRAAPTQDWAVGSDQFEEQMLVNLSGRQKILEVLKKQLGSRSPAYGRVLSALLMFLDSRIGFCVNPNDQTFRRLHRVREEAQQDLLRVNNESFGPDHVISIASTAQVYDPFLHSHQLLMSWEISNSSSGEGDCLDSFAGLEKELFSSVFGTESGCYKRRRMANSSDCMGFGVISMLYAMASSLRVLATAIRYRSARQGFQAEYQLRRYLQQNCGGVSHVLFGIKLHLSIISLASGLYLLSDLYTTAVHRPWEAVFPTLFRFFHLWIFSTLFLLHCYMPPRRRVAVVSIWNFYRLVITIAILCEVLVVLTSAIGHCVDAGALGAAFHQMTLIDKICVYSKLNVLTQQYQRKNTGAEVEKRWTLRLRGGDMHMELGSFLFSFTSIIHDRADSYLGAIFWLVMCMFMLLDFNKGFISRLSLGWYCSMIDGWKRFLMMSLVVVCGLIFMPIILYYPFLGVLPFHV